ncbi:helix-turn-helix domain-containing protein [Bacteroides fragilis]|nr:helix-turn-helix domain-containing protein [Bacteroides fragilis]
MGDVGFCYSSQSLSKAETVYKLRSQLSDLLKLFLESPDYELTNEQIKKALWIALGDIPTSDKKNRIISDLRKELETFHVPVLIETKGKMGYRLVPKAT